MIKDENDALHTAQGVNTPSTILMHPLIPTSLEAETQLSKIGRILHLGGGSLCMVVQFGPLKLDQHVETAAYIFQSSVAKQSRRADRAVVGFPKQTPTSGLFWNAPVQLEEAKGAQ